MTIESIPKSMLTVGVVQMYPSAKLPELGSLQAACFDLRLAFADSAKSVSGYDSHNSPIEVTLGYHTASMGGVRYVTIPPRHRILAPTGLVFNLPEGYSLRLYSRSGLAVKKGLVLANGEGIIDSDYRGHVQGILTNLSDENVEVCEGDRIMQAELVLDTSPYVQFMFDAGVLETKRGSGGFGHTGRA